MAKVHVSAGNRVRISNPHSELFRKYATVTSVLCGGIGSPVANLKVDGDDKWTFKSARVSDLELVHVV